LIEQPFEKIQLIPMIRGLIFIFLIVFSVSQVFPAETKISGMLPGGSGNEIRMIAYADYISYTEILLGRTIVNSIGEFNLMADILETQQVILDLDFYTTTFYLEPGKNYLLQFDSISMADQYRPFYEKEPLVFRIVSDEPNELNNLIFEFNDVYNAFLVENFQSIYNRRNKSLIIAFKSEMDQKYAYSENLFFKNYVDFKIASIELSASGTNKPLLFRQYLLGKPILYFHSAYMEFFNQFFDQYLTAGNKFISEKDLEKGINDLINLPALMDSLGKDTLLLSESLRELVLIKTLQELYYSPFYYPQNILTILDQIIATSHFSLHRSMAMNVRLGLTRLQKGTLPPDFSLADLTGKPANLSDHQGKPVYLSFLTTWTFACLAEYKIMDSLYGVWGNDIEFITVSLDKTPEVVARFKKDKNYNWTFLYNGTGYDLIQDYGIKTFPLFVLIDGEGKIMQYPAIKPSEGIGEVFTYMKEKSKE
jgi:peroxiredoxin